jgi:hypothetical protein
VGSEGCLGATLLKPMLPVRLTPSFGLFFKNRPTEPWEIVSTSLGSDGLPEEGSMPLKDDPVAVDPSAETGQVDGVQTEVSAGLEH